MLTFDIALENDHGGTVGSIDTKTFATVATASTFYQSLEAIVYGPYINPPKKSVINTLSTKPTLDGMKP